MSGVAEFLPLLAFAVFVAGLVAFALWRRARRRRRMAAWAAGHGYAFEERDDRLARRFQRFEPFGAGRARKAWHVVRGDRDGIPFVAFQYEHTTGSGKSQQHHVHTVCALRSPLSCPGLTLRRERLHHKLFDALGGEDIDVESDAFSRRFWVRGPDRRFAYDVLHPRMMEYLMPLDRYLWQWRGEDLVLVQGGAVEPRHVEAMLGAGAGMVALLPRHLHPTPS